MSNRTGRRSTTVRTVCLAVVLVSTVLSTPAPAGDGNRLAYLDSFVDPYYVGLEFPRLATPQWVGEESVEAVAVLAIDDMRDVERYEAYLRPILDRLKEIDGRAGLSIMTCSVDPEHPHLQTWLGEGVSLEVHTVDHPCPLLQEGDFDAARSTYERCIDLMADIPGNHPVAYRMPCCDSRNTPSPRFWAEIFNRTTPDGHYLQLDSSVFHVFTDRDSELPRDLVLTEDGGPRFRRYLPFPSFVNTIDDYPYPYVIGGLSWQFPCMVPSDWEAQHVQQPNNPRTVEDLERALDATVIKQGVFNLVFHPHGWMRNVQVVELIDHAVDQHGEGVLFLSFREAAERINGHLLDGHPLRDSRGRDNGVRLLDLNGDDYLDVVIGHPDKKMTRVWEPEARRWRDANFPTLIVDAQGRETGVRFLPSPSADDGAISAIAFTGQPAAWTYRDGDWREDEELLAGLADGDAWTIPEASSSLDDGRRFRDVDGDGRVELIDGGTGRGEVWNWVAAAKGWQRAGYRLPEGLSVVDREGRDAGLRLRDLNGDGRLDIVYSNEQRFHAALFDSQETGWSRRLAAGRAGTAGAIPLISRGGENNGAWFHSRHLWVQNEDTNRLADGVDRLTFQDLVAREVAGRGGGRTFPVGASVVDITPDYPVRLSGYGSRSTESEGVEQRIGARALAIGGDEDPGPAILIQFENCGVTSELRDTVVERLAASRGVDPDRVAICVTHTHSAPWIEGYASFLFAGPLPESHQEHMSRYTRELTDRLVEVAEQALDARRPGTLEYARGSVDFAVNRRVIRDGAWTGFGEQADGPVDHSLGLLVARDTEGRIISLVANYACHCTTLGGDFNRICGDWAGYAQEYLEESHESAVAMIVIGCGADANPGPRGSLEHCRAHGEAIHGEVQRLLSGPLRRLPGPPDCRLVWIDLPLGDPPPRSFWEQQARERGVTGHHAQYFLDMLDRGESLPDTVRYPVGSWSFGDDLVMVLLGGEVVVDYAIRFHREFDDERLWITAYANDVPCYIPSRRILREGGYEADSSMRYYARPSRLAPETEDLIADTVQRVVPAAFYSAERQQEFPPPRSPDAGLASFRVPEGWRVELVAAEPLIEDPVAFDWGPDGRLWVVEMRDYPNGMDGNQSPGGRIKVLDDDDGDGRYDRATVFLDDLPFPTGVKVWRQGILITAAPDILFARDLDGDDRADTRVALYSGFGEGNQQHRVNGLRWGLDNWLHVGNGDSGGRIRSHVTGDTVDVSGRDLRIAPDIGLLDAESGQTQFGRCRDDWGNWFGGNNSFPMWQYVLSDGYLRRNPHLIPPAVRVHTSVQPGAAPVFPASRTLARFNDFDKANRFTSACSPIIYRDSLAADLVDNALVCEPVHNLVHREVMWSDGVVFRSRRAESETSSEFLASTDNWFRPSMVRTGPDGAVWVADMYRFVIEHPKWIPAAWQRRLDVRAGEGMGRIYRVFPADAPPRAFPRLSGLAPRELAEHLNHPSGWVRDTAHQMILWAPEQAALTQLKDMVEDSGPLGRLHALCVLEGLDELAPDLLVVALRDEHPGVRRHAIRLSESRLSSHPEVARAVLNRLDDSDPFVTMQLAYTLGAWQDDRAYRALGRLAVRHRDEPYLRAAVFSSLRAESIQPVMQVVLEARRFYPELFEPLLSQALAFDRPDVVNGLLLVVLQGDESPLAEPVRLERAARLLETLDRRRDRLRQVLAEDVSDRLESLAASARATVADSSAALEDRITAVRLLARPLIQQQQDVELLAALLGPREPPELQRAAVLALGSGARPSAGAAVLEQWRVHSPTLRAEILDMLLAREGTTAELIDAIRRGHVTARQLDALQRQRLLQHRDENLRLAAEEALTGDSGSRSDVVAAARSALDQPGDAERGRASFARRCAPCHQLDGIGHTVGPDLAALTDRTEEALLVAILDPNRAVENRFQAYQVITSDGLVLSGVLIQETTGSITLASQDGKTTTVARTDIDLMQANGKSLMPEGLEQDMDAQELRDLIAYLRRTGPPPKQFPGNEPRVAHVRDDGSIRLLAIDCRIYGPTLVFEPRYRNLGYWHSEADHAIWSLQVKRSGSYRVSMEYACPDDIAGDRFQIQVAGQTLGGKVEGTGTWDDYRSVNLGTVELEEGPAELVFRSQGPIRSALLDLRAIRLIPIDP